MHYFKTKQNGVGLVPPHTPKWERYVKLNHSLDSTIMMSLMLWADWESDRKETIWKNLLGFFFSFFLAPSSNLPWKDIEELLWGANQTRLPYDGKLGALLVMLYRPQQLFLFWRRKMRALRKTMHGEESFQEGMQSKKTNKTLLLPQIIITIIKTEREGEREEREERAAALWDRSKPLCHAEWKQSLRLNG